MPIPAGYTNLSKFTDRREEGYQMILSVIKKIARPEKKTEPQVGYLSIQFTGIYAEKV